MSILTARDLLAMLHRHYVPDNKQPPGIFATEVEMHGRRADLIWQPVTVAGRSTLVGHEIKVTRQDLASELANPLKTDAWLQYCTTFFLVIPDPGMIDGIDVPDKWGILAPPSGRRTRSMTVVRKPRALVPIPQEPALRALLCWQHWRLDTATRAAQNALTIQRADAATIEKLRVEVQRARAAASAAGHPLTAGAELVMDIVTRLGGTYRRGDPDGDWNIHVTADDVVQTLRDLAYARRQHKLAAGNLTHTLTRTRQLRDALDRALVQVPPLPTEEDV